MIPPRSRWRKLAALFVGTGEPQAASSSRMRSSGSFTPCTMARACPGRGNRSDQPRPFDSRRVGHIDRVVAPECENLLEEECLGPRHVEFEDDRPRLPTALVIKPGMRLLKPEDEHTGIVGKIVGQASDRCQTVEQCRLGFRELYLAGPGHCSKRIEHLEIGLEDDF